MNLGTQLLVITLLIAGASPVVNALDVVKLSRMLNVTMYRNKLAEKSVQKKSMQLKNMLDLEKMEETWLEWDPTSASFLYDLGRSLDWLEECLESDLRENKEDIKSNIKIARNLLNISRSNKKIGASTLFNAILRLLFYVKPSLNESYDLLGLRMAFLDGLYKIYEPAMAKYQNKNSSGNKLPPGNKFFLFVNARINANDYERKVIGWMEQDVNWVPLSLSVKMMKNFKKEQRKKTSVQKGQPIKSEFSMLEESPDEQRANLIKSLEGITQLIKEKSKKSQEIEIIETAIMQLKGDEHCDLSNVFNTLLRILYCAKIDESSAAQGNFYASGDIADRIAVNIVNAFVNIKKIDKNFKPKPSDVANAFEKDLIKNLKTWDQVTIWQVIGDWRVR